MKLYRVSAFLKTPTGGNKAGVALDVEKLSDTEMQAIAKDVGFSETAFVKHSDQADFLVRFFSPTCEVNLCGHATIATFNVLRDTSVINEGLYTQETKAGILQLDVQKDVVYMEQNQPLFLDVLGKEEVETCFLESDFVDERYPIQVVSTGLKEIFIPVKSVALLHQLTPNMKQITTVSNKYQTIGIHAFSLDDEVDAYGRNFAPVVGIDEESATGTSNGALSCYLYRYVNPKETYVLRQGYSMNQPSELYSKIEAKDGVINRIWVGGTAKIID